MFWMGLSITAAFPNFHLAQTFRLHNANSTYCLHLSGYINITYPATLYHLSSAGAACRPYAHPSPLQWCCRCLQLLLRGIKKSTCMGHSCFLQSGLPGTPSKLIVCRACLHAGLDDMGLHHCRLLARGTNICLCNFPITPCCSVGHQSDNGNSNDS